MRLFRAFTNTFTSARLLVELSVGHIKKSPFSDGAVAELKNEIIKLASSHGLELRRDQEDRDDVSIDFRFMQLVLDLAGDPGRSRSCTWFSSESIWRRNYATLAPLEEQVLEVLHEQASRGQIIVLPEKEAKERYPALVIASLGANRKEKPDGRITARVLFDGTNGLEVNKRTRVRDQERAPVAADLKRSMRAKAARGEKTFAVTADVTEAHRQVPIHPQDWRLLGCHVRSGGDVFINTVGTFGVASASYYWSRIAAALGRLTQYTTGRSATTWHTDDF